MNISDCKGCRSNQHMYKSYTICFILYEEGPEVTKHIPMCPCASCIVKMICKTGCSEFMNHATQANIIMRYIKRKVVNEPT